MKKLIYLIPLLVFIITVIASSVHLKACKYALYEVFDQAGKNCEPVIIICGSTIRGKRCNLVASPDGAMIIWPSNRLVTSGDCSYITKSGILRFFRPNETIHWEVRHEYRLPSTSLTPWRKDASGLVEDFAWSDLESLSDRIKLYYVDSRHFLDEPEVVKRGISITDLESFNESFIELYEQPQWEIQDPESYVHYTYISPDGSVIFLEVFFPQNLCQVWRYDIPHGPLKHVLDSICSIQLSIGPEGRIISCSETRLNLNSTIFYDGNTGEELYVVNNVTPERIGEHWAVCRYYRDDTKLMVVDLNTWEEHVINTPGNLGWPIYLYEPPPGGVKEMLEMRKSGE